jgi:hypothetical protein
MLGGLSRLCYNWHNPVNSGEHDAERHVPHAVLSMGNGNTSGWMPSFCLDSLSISLPL